MHRPDRSPNKSPTNLASCIVATIFLFFILAIALIVFFCLFRPKDPQISVTSVRFPTFSLSNNTVNFTFSQYASVTNPNRYSLSHYDSSLSLLYSSSQVGFIFIPAGQIPPGRTQYMTATFSVQSFPLIATAPQYGGFGEGLAVVAPPPTMEIESRLKMAGRVRVLVVFTHRVETSVRCSVVIEIVGFVYGNVRRLFEAQLYKLLSWIGIPNIQAFKATKHSSIQGSVFFLPTWFSGLPHRSIVSVCRPRFDYIENLPLMSLFSEIHIPLLGDACNCFTSISVIKSLHYQYLKREDCNVSSLMIIDLKSSSSGFCTEMGKARVKSLKQLKPVLFYDGTNSIPYQQLTRQCLLVGAAQIHSNKPAPSPSAEIVQTTPSLLQQPARKGEFIITRRAKANNHADPSRAIKQKPFDKLNNYCIPSEEVAVMSVRNKIEAQNRSITQLRDKIELIFRENQKNLVLI
ncbi:Late embryogenesis abundant protein, LEA_2 subgroup [Dillenia turbinata]|uniref:Late embryogenesis abundant protein, LEA_2 subgroup n=1 Tax=Dillenia turbinata TaxID=194707 RepID=A0AAN8YYK8_9MAGN